MFYSVLILSCFAPTISCTMNSAKTRIPNEQKEKWEKEWKDQEEREKKKKELDKKNWEDFEKRWANREDERKMDKEQQRKDDEFAEAVKERDKMIKEREQRFLIRNLKRG